MPCGLNAGAALLACARGRASTDAVPFSSAGCAWRTRVRLPRARSRRAGKCASLRPHPAGGEVNSAWPRADGREGAT